MKYIDFNKMYQSGIEGTFMGGEIIGDEYFCPRDVEEGNFSEPKYKGKLQITKTMKIDDKFIAINGSFILTRDEYEKGIVEV